MFAEFLNIIVRSLKLDKTLYKDNRNFGEAAIYFAGLIIILGGIAGAIAANTIIKTPIAMSGLTQMLNWLVWSILIYVIGVKIFPDKNIKVPFDISDGNTLNNSLKAPVVDIYNKAFHILGINKSIRVLHLPKHADINTSTTTSGAQEKVPQTINAL